MIPRKQLGNLTPEELCQEANLLRRELETSVEYLNEIYTALYTKVRRSEVTELTLAYTSVASTGKRLSNVLSQSIGRSFTVTGGLLARANKEVVYRQEELDRKKQRIEKKKAPKPTQDPFEALFGVSSSRSSNIDSIGRQLGTPSDLGSSLKDLYGDA
jgi:hypothetical protein